MDGILQLFQIHIKSYLNKFLHGGWYIEVKIHKVYLENTFSRKGIIANNELSFGRYLVGYLPKGEVTRNGYLVFSFFGEVYLVQINNFTPKCGIGKMGILDKVLIEFLLIVCALESER